MTFANMTIEDLKKTYLGKEVHVIINDPYHPIDAWGTVTRVDSIGQLHGTWGGVAAMPGQDYIGLDD